MRRGKHPQPRFANERLAFGWILVTMVQPPPDTGGAATMPVIPPPGTPGGNPNVRPQ